MIQPATSNRDIEYKCSACGRNVGRDNLRAKQVAFREMGRNGKVIKSRTIAWLCVVPLTVDGKSCLDKDPDYNRETWFDSPGLQDVKDAKLAGEE